MNVGRACRSGYQSVCQVCVWALFVCMGLGCGLQQFVPPGNLPYAKLSANYRQVVLNRSNTLDVLRMIQASTGALNPKYVSRELVSQNDTAVATSGRSKSGKESWFSLFVFDEQKMTADRKYFFCLDESTCMTPTPPQKVLLPPRPSLIFDTQMIVSDILAQDFVSEQARNITLMDHLAQRLQEDVQPFDIRNGPTGSGNHILAVSGMFMHNVLRTIQEQFEQSPSLALKLGTREGLVFNHMLLNTGRVQMVVINDTLVARIEVGLPLPG